MTRRKRKPRTRDRLLYWGAHAAALGAILTLLWQVPRVRESLRAWLDQPVDRRIERHEQHELDQEKLEGQRMDDLQRAIRMFARGMDESPGTRARSRLLRHVYADTTGRKPR